MTRLARAFADENEELTFLTSVYDLQEFDPKRGIAIDDLAVSFAPTIHYIPCWAMRVGAAGQGELGYTADTGPAAPLAPFFSGVEVLIAEATLADPDDAPFDQRGHLTAREAGDLARRASARTLILSHIWEEIGFARQHTDAASVFEGQVVVAHPGVTVEW